MHDGMTCIICNIIGELGGIVHAGVWEVVFYLGRNGSLIYQGNLLHFDYVE